jgi:BirA family biotin operon repressor/biotin-[acetyl-CoA-carboxylase] ligase
MDNLIGNTIIRLQETESTNNYANNQVQTNDYPEGTVFLAYSQTAGRGQINNKWESEPGKNLTFSILFYPDFLEIRDQFMLSKVVSLGIRRTLAQYIDDVSIKWPNDIYAGNRKICGILIENSILYGQIKNSIVGIGLNVNQEIFRSNAPNPVSLSILTKKQFDLDALLAQLLDGIDHYYKLLCSGNNKAINQEFESHLFRIGKIYSFNDETGPFDGTILGVNDIGQLLIRKESGEIRAYHFKEVEYII